MKSDNVDHIPKEYFKKMKDLEEKLIIFLDKHDNLNKNLAIFDQYLQNQNLFDNKHELKSFLYILVAITNNYHRSKDFFQKIELIVKILQEKVLKYFSSFEIFLIFQRNKRFLLFLFQFKILTPTEDIYNIILNNKKYIDRKYLEYFYPEFETFMDEKIKNSIHDQIQELKESNQEFNKKRENGENDNYLCTLVQNDSVIDFITYVEKNNISLHSTIPPSIYETNLFLINNNPTLIEYSAFYGSIQIFKYLYIKKVEIETSIWQYAIHGRNAEIIHFLEENNIQTLCNSYQYLIIESIKCHHNELSDYFRTNFCEEEKIYDYYLYRKALKYYNFGFFTDDIINSLINSCNTDQQLNIPFYLCKYDYFLIIEFLVNCNSRIKIDINEKFTIYKPSLENSFNIVQNIAIKNGVVDQKSEEDEKLEKKDKVYYDILMQRRQFTTYEYETENLTILNIAVQKGNIDIIILLLKLPEINTNSISIKKYKEDMESIKDYVEYFKVTEEKTILIEAFESGYLEVFQFLLKNIVLDVNCKLLRRKFYYDNFSTSRMCYEFNHEKRLLHHAIKKGNIEIVKLLLSNPDININLQSFSKIKKSGGCAFYSSSERLINKSSLYFAIKYGSIKMIQLLLAQPSIDVNLGIKEVSKDLFETEIKLDKTPLHLAVEKQDLQIVKLLLEKPEININYESILVIYKGCEKVIQKNTPLQLATEKQNIEIIEIFKNKTSNANEDFKLKKT